MSQRADAATDRVSYTASAPPAPATAFTATFWARLRVDRDDFSTMLRLHSSSGGSTSINIATGSSGTTPVVVSPGNTGGIVGADALAVDTWRMIAVTVAGTGATDGKIYTKTVGGATNVTTGQVSGGGTPDGLTLFGRSIGDATEWFNGALSYVRIWSAILTQTEIEAEWASATAVRTSGLWAHWPMLTDINDTSGNGRNLTAGSTALSTESDPPLAATVTGSALASFGTLTATINGTRQVSGSTTISFGALSGAANGTRTVSGAGAFSGALLTGTSNGTRTTHGSGALSSGSMSGSASGTRTVVASANGQLGGLTASATSPSNVTGTAAASLGTLSATASGGVPAPPRRGSWDGLLNVYYVGAVLHDEERQRVPQACLDCGEPLRPGPRGELYCSFDGSMWAAGNRRVYHSTN